MRPPRVSSLVSDGCAMSDKLRWLGRNAEEVICAAMMTFMTVLGFTWLASAVSRMLGMRSPGVHAPERTLSHMRSAICM